MMSWVLPLALALRAPTPMCRRLTVRHETEITMPALSSTMTSGRVVSWLKSVGDKVEAGDPIIVVESDKADMEVESYEDGYLARVLIGEGEDADVGATIGLLVAEESEIATVSAAAPAAAAAAAPAAAPAAAAPAVDSTPVTMPALSSTMKTGRVVSWLKSVGDKVEAGDAVMVVESDKADMEVESYDEGFVAAILVPEGDEADVGATVALLAPSKEEIAAVAAAGAAPVAAAVAAAPAAAAPAAAPVVTKQQGERVSASGYARKLAADSGVDINSVAGSGPGGRVVGRDIDGGTKSTKWTPTPGATTATPSAVKLAKSKGLDLATIKGTGNFGRVTKDDVEAALGLKKAAPVLAAEPATKASLPSGPVDMTGMQKAIAKNMEATLAVPVFRVSKIIRTDAFDALYQKLKPDGVTVSALLAKAVATALTKNPLLNAKYEPGKIVYNGDVNVAMAVALDGGLITPTLRNADAMNLGDLSKLWKELVGKAKAKTLSPDEYTTGTFTISNLGMFDVAQFDAILPVGQAAILAIGSSKPTVVPMDGALLNVGVVKQMTVTITCDHRIVGGAEAASFLNDLKSAIEAPLGLTK